MQLNIKQVLQDLQDLFYVLLHVLFFRLEKALVGCKSPPGARNAARLQRVT